MGDLFRYSGSWMLAAFSAASFAVGPGDDGPRIVTIQQSGSRARLVRDGEEYFVRGAGGDSHLELLAQVGGNSIRTWGVSRKTGELLDKAHGEGLTVTLGIWLSRVGDVHYGDEVLLAQQRVAVMRAVKAYRDHPALLMWAIGNEMEGDGDDPRVYEQLERLSVEVKKLDPAHPVMTVIADLGGGKKVRDLNRLAPSIDVIGINSYGAAKTVAQRYRKAGGTRPFMLTEFGPRGHWESGRTSYGLPIEPSSSAKVESYRQAYEGSVAKEPLCLGSYAFLWGSKQETTATWYGMLLPDGTRLGAVDLMQELWTGKKPKNRCPVIEEVAGIAKPEELRPNQELKVRVKARDPDRDRLEVQWVLRPASRGDGAYGRPEDALGAVAESIRSAKGLKAAVKMPSEPGNYRLFAYVRDGEGGAAVANVALRVLP